MDLASIVHELYGLGLDDFTGTRNARSKQARESGDKDLAAQVKSLPKPSTVAWVVNLLAREDPREIVRLLDLGAAMRAAQEGLDGSELRELDARRRDLTSTLAERGRDLARAHGRELSDSVASRVAQTLRGAIADPLSSGAVAAGQLTGELTSTGFGVVDLSGTVAAPELLTEHVPQGSPADEDGGDNATGSGGTRSRPMGRDPEPAQRTRPALTKAQAWAAKADDAVAGATRSLETEQQRLDRARQDVEELTAQKRELEGRLKELRTQHEHAKSELRAAERRRDKADRVAAKARETADRAHRQVDNLQP